jgi:GT2 family glycosyltransferase
MDVSVIIVSWNTREILGDCLRSAYEQAEGIECEVIVVDNASSDGSAEMVKRDFEKTILIENTENRGFAAANNQGMAVAKGRYALLLNSDTIVLDNAIAKTVELADRHPDTAVTGCRVLNPDGSLQPTCFMFPSLLNMFLAAAYLYKLFPRNRFFGRERMTWWDRNDERDVEVVTGCMMLVRRSAIERVGVMDERYFMYCEETDWCYRFRQAGWRVMFTPSAEIIHLGGQSSRKVRKEMLIQLKLSVLEFMKKHHGWAAHKAACLLTIAFFAVRMPIWFVRSLLAGEGKEQAALRFDAYRGAVGRIMLPAAELAAEEGE